MTASRPAPWSRAAIICGVLSIVAFPASIYYASSCAIAVLALALALVGRLRGERSWHAWIWPTLGALIGALAFGCYLRLTGEAAHDQQTADKVLQDNFADSFDENFKNMIGDSGVPAPSSWPGSVSRDGGW